MAHGASGQAKPSIAILGAGMSGLCMAIKLSEAGFDDFTIYEKADNVGGTWRDNTYPGLACDVPSHLYSFSFEPNPDWSHVFSPGWEIQDYFERCTGKYGLRGKIHFNAEIASARYHEGAGLWHLTSTNGEPFTANVVVTAVGALHRPKVPDIPGLKDFAGIQFHSACWNHDHDLKGKTVAVIGSAASAVQIVPTIAPEVNRLYVYQRTPNWIRPRDDHAYPASWKQAFRKYPVLRLLHRWMIYWRLESRFPAFLQGRKRGQQEKQECLDHLTRQVPDAELRRKLTPDYPPGCKRILVSDDYYPALMRDNVELVTTAIDHIEADGIVTADGQKQQVDTIILATGFHVAEMLAPMEVTGRGGIDLNQAWANGVEAHRTVALPGFPNFFMLLGPNSGLGHNSIIFMVEAQVRYIMQCLKAMANRGLKALEPKKATSDDFNAHLQDDMKKTVWMGGCQSWYQDDNGKVVALWPHGTVRYWRDMRRARLSEYEQAKVS